MGCGNTEFMYHQKEKTDTSHSASCNHKWTLPRIASSILKSSYRNQECLIAAVSERRGIAPGFVVLSDTVFRNNSQQGGPEQGLRCHGKWGHMSN